MRKHSEGLCEGMFEGPCDPQITLVSLYTQGRSVLLGFLVTTEPALALRSGVV